MIFIMKQKIADTLMVIMTNLGIDDVEIKIEYPENIEYGDYSSNVAMVYSKRLKSSPMMLAKKVISEFDKLKLDFIDTVTSVSPGFINFKLKANVVAQGIINSVSNPIKENRDMGEKVMIEYTDPNTFKAFHVGHIMSNTIGESISRLIEFSGKSVIRICYPSDIGLHIAKSIWSMQQHLADIPGEAAPIEERTAFLGKMYVEGTNSYDADPSVKNEIDELNQVLYDKSDVSVNELYEKGRRWSLEHFDMLYELLGTKFDEQIFESDMAPVGLKIVLANMVMSKNDVSKTMRSEGHGQHTGGIFEESDGAVVFKGEEYGLHTRVFINSRGLPTYETKDLGLNVTKFQKYGDAIKSIIVTANEQNDYFSVLTKVLSLLDNKDGEKTLHIGHGMLRFSEGKMSSRTGNIITAHALISEIEKMVMERLVLRDLSSEEVDDVSEIIAIGAIKFTILRQAIGSNVIFDSAASISFEGDSGPYLQYSAVRAASVLEKSSKFSESSVKLPDNVGILEKLIIRFPDIAVRASLEYSPQTVANYLLQLGAAFNSFYASQVIIDEKDPLSNYRILLTKAFHMTMVKGLWLLGIKVPTGM